MIDILSPAVPIPKYYFKLLASGDRQIDHSRRFLDNIQGQEITSKRNYKDVPPNATIRSEDVKCGKSFCFRCPHGPYYYGYWKDVNGRLKKKYIGTNFDPSWKMETKAKSKSAPSLVKSQNEMFRERITQMEQIDKDMWKNQHKAYINAENH
jgi:hypothetical protein